MLVKSQVKYIQSLGDKKFRDGDKSFVAEGPKLVAELLNSGLVEPVGLYATEDWMPPAGNTFQRVTISRKELERISFLTTPNQVLAIFKKPVFDATRKQKIILMLDHIQDPGNLGTMIRTADWFGIGLVVCSLETADIFNPKAVQATMGGIVRVQVQYLDLREYLLHHPQIPVYATVPHAASPVDPATIHTGIIIIGNESRGISEELLAMANHTISIPGSGEAESLNAAVAAGIILSKTGTSGH
jgi:RNA methyltransferase, TrmH family